MHDLPPRNKYTGKRAQNIAFVRTELQELIRKKREKGHHLNHDILMACKYLLAIEGVAVDGWKQAEKKPRKDKGKKPTPIKPPALMNAAV